MSDAEDEALADGVMTALRRVIDPELGYNIVDLGLVYRVEIENGAVQVIMTTTTRGCQMPGSRGKRRRAKEKTHA